MSFYQPTVIPGLRSPYDMVSGVIYFGRMLDKIRLSVGGRLPEGWWRGDEMEGSFDWRCCKFLKLPYTVVEAETLKGDKSDEEMLEWAFATGHRPDQYEIDVWNEFMRKRGWNDSGTTYLRQILALAALPTETVETYFDLIDLDEGRRPLPGSQSKA